MARTKVNHLTLDERRQKGNAARARTPRAALESWQPASDRPDPVGLLAEQDAVREPDLVPVRHGRMAVSPFTFYRGAARIMAADLASIPRSGLDVQLCGDAHLSNFGAYASPERTLLFDLNDFDETLPGPFEYDVARLAAAFVVASRQAGFKGADARAAATAAVAAYRQAMAEFAGMRTPSISGTRGWTPSWSCNVGSCSSARVTASSRSGLRRICKRREARTVPGPVTIDRDQ